MRLNLSQWALRNRSLVIYFMIIAVVAGVFSYKRLGRAEDPTFVIKTMVVQAAWPGATVDDTLNQVTERLERTLQETEKLDFLRSYTKAGVATIFVNLRGDTTAQEVRDIWDEVRRNVADMRHTLPMGIVGPGFNDNFGDTSSTVSRRMGSATGSFATTSRACDRSCCRCPMSRRSKFSALRMKKSSSNSRCKSWPRSASTGRR
jgi:multidrug efflux pump subunit AcrB